MSNRLAFVAALACLSASPAFSQSKTMSGGDMLGACIGYTEDSDYFRGRPVFVGSLTAESYMIADKRVWLYFDSPKHSLKVLIRVDNPKAIPRGFRKGAIVSVRGFVEDFNRFPPIDGACVFALRDGATIQLDGF